MQTSSLDEIIVRLAVKIARKLMAAGYATENAVAASCPGAWRDLRTNVLARLKEAGG